MGILKNFARGAQHSAFTRELANDYEYIEIGGLKWATKNVGAKDEFDNGLYFQWGDVNGYTAEDVKNGKKQFFWRDCAHHNRVKFTKYIREDGKVVLDLEDDAARAHMGGSWRMPTEKEFRQFLRGVETDWVDNYKGSGVSGLICTDKTDNSKVLFFPAAGLCFCYSQECDCVRGGYWSSSCDMDANNARCFSFNLYEDDVDDNFSRYCGLSVRGVMV